MTEKADFFGETYSWALLQPKTPTISTWLKWCKERLREMEG